MSDLAVAPAVATHDPPAHEPERLKLHGHIPALDGLRGLAIALVMLSHFIPYSDHPGSLAGRIFFFIGRCGWCGVDLFFVLSGFLITGILLQAKGKEHYFRNFYARRTLRIFPLYYLTLAIVFLIVPLLYAGAFASPELAAIRRHQGWLWSYCTNVFMTFHYDTTYFHSDWLNLNPFWSLAVEEHFYLIWPAIVFFISRRAVPWVCLACIAASIASRAFMTARGHVDTIYVFTPCRVDALAMGGLLAASLPRVKLSARTLLAYARAAAIILGIANLLILWSSPDRISLLSLTAGYSLIGAFFAALLVMALVKSPGASFESCMKSPVLRILGKYSYGLYVYHVLLASTFEYYFGQPLINNVLRARLHLGGAAYGASVFIFIILATIASFTVAWLSWHLFEKQFLRLKKYFP
jgi:peptidoglycan/LPS O-acetylase OafA/YrhL